MFFAYDYHLFRIAAGFFNFKSFSANAKTFEASQMFVVAHMIITGMLTPQDLQTHFYVPFTNTIPA